MATLWFASAMKAVPWKEMVILATKIVEVAGRLGGGSGPKKAQSQEPGADIRELRADFKRLQQNQEEQVSLVRDIAGQLDLSSRAFEVLRARLTIALSVAVLALVVGIVAIIVDLWT